MFCVKSICSRYLGRKNLIVDQVRLASKTVDVAVQSNQEVSNKFKFVANVSCRTSETDPTRHHEGQEAMFYSMPKDIQTKLFTVFNWHKTTHELFNVLHETAIMIRKPALQLMQTIRETDLEQPLRRFIVSGRAGSGRSFTLTHLTHFGHKANFILVHCVSPNVVTRFPQETAPSEFRPGRMDTPIDAALMLQHFKAQNAHLLTDLTTSQEYTWSLREKTEKGEPLMNVIDHGINRMKHSSDCYAVLLKELKLAANESKCKVMVLVDKINLFYWASNVRQPDRRFAEIDEITVARAVKKLFKKDWKNSILIGAVDKHSSDELEQNFSDDPKDILLENGCKDLTPYEEIKMENYTKKEFHSCLEYYNDRHFLHHPAIFTDEGRAEVKFISAMNPLDLYQFCKSL